jgi:O-antigen/teichoic acid export membrane protein
LALVIHRNLVSVVVALVVYAVVGAAVSLFVANHVFSRASGRSLIGKIPSQFTERRAMLRTVFHTNVVSYARIAQVQLPTLLLGALTTTTEVGLYKIGAAAGAMVGRTADPVYASILPRLSRLWALDKRDEIARLLRQATPVAAAVVGTTLVLLIVFRAPLLRLIGGDDAVDAAPVLVLVGVGYAVSSILFWNTSLLFAAGRSGIVSLIALVSVVVQAVLLVPLAITYEASGAALALGASLTLSNLLAAVLALRELRAVPTGQSQSVSSSSDHFATAISSEYEVRT